MGVGRGILGWGVIGKGWGRAGGTVEFRGGAVLGGGGSWGLFVLGRVEKWGISGGGGRGAGGHSGISSVDGKG